MDVKLGPMPKPLRDVVRSWVGEVAEGADTADPTTGGVLIYSDVLLGYYLTQVGTSGNTNSMGRYLAWKMAP